MTPDAAFVEMIGRNLSYFEQLLQASEGVPVDRLVDDLDGLYRSIEFGAHNAAVNRRAGELFVASWQTIEQHGNYAQWARLAIRVANRYEDADTFLLCRIVTLLGTLQHDSGDLVKAEKTFRMAEQLAIAKEDTGAIANAWYYRATYEFKTNNIGSARTYLNKGNSLLEEDSSLADDDYRRIKGFNLNLLGMTYSSEGNYQLAIDCLSQAQHCLASLETGHYEAIPLVNLARVYALDNQFESAEHAYQKAIVYARKFNQTVTVSQTLRGYADLLEKIGKPQEAFERLAEIDLNALQKMGHVRHVAFTKYAIGKHLVRQQKYEQARSYLIESSDLWIRLSDTISCAMARGYLAFSEYEMGARIVAIQILTDAIHSLESEMPTLWNDAQAAYEQFKSMLEEIENGRL